MSKAPAFTKTTMMALESIVLNKEVSVDQRLAAAKLRLCIQASIRHSDMQNTPLSACEWVRKPGSNMIIGLRSRARKGKTGPRLWIISLRGASPDGDRWVQAMVELLINTHGPDWKHHDYMGRMPSAIAGEFLAGPSRIEVDVTSVKNALEEFGRSGGDTGLSESELSLLRWHGAKASMSSIMQHLNIPPKVVRIQGAWRNKEDAMADSYLRAAQILVLEAQERCLSYLRNGGDLPHLTGEPLGGKLPPEEDMPDDKSRVEEAMGAPKHFAARMETLPPELLSEKDFDEEKKIKDGILVSEVENLVSDHQASECLDDYSPTSPADTDFGEEVKRVLPVLEDGGEGPVNASEIQEKFDALDTEGMVQALVQTRAPTDNSKLHLPKMDPEDDELPALATPRCGVRGVFDYIHAEEEPCSLHEVPSWPKRGKFVPCNLWSTWIDLRSADLDS